MREVAISDAIVAALNGARVLIFDLDEVVIDIRTQLQRFAIQIGIPVDRIVRSRYDLGLSVNEMNAVLDFAIPRGIFRNAAPMQRSVAAIKEIASRGYEIHYATHRGCNQSADTEMLEIVREHTLNAVSQAGLPSCTSVHFCASSKLPVIQRLCGDIVIDDHPEVIAEAHGALHQRSGMITGLLFAAEHHTPEQQAHPWRIDCISHLLEYLPGPPDLL